MRTHVLVQNGHSALYRTTAACLLTSDKIGHNGHGFLSVRLRCDTLPRMTNDETTQAIAALKKQRDHWLDVSDRDDASWQYHMAQAGRYQDDAMRHTNYAFDIQAEIDELEGN